MVRLSVGCVVLGFNCLRCLKTHSGPPAVLNFDDSSIDDLYVGGDGTAMSKTIEFYQALVSKGAVSTT